MMINKTNIDVQIYVDKLMEGLNQMGLIESLSDEWGVRDQDEFKDVLTENLVLGASLKFEESGDPTLGETEFEGILVRSVTEYTINDMVEEGVLTKKLDENGVENVYSINPEMKKLIDGEEDN
jgi:hypothetical protein